MQLKRRPDQFVTRPADTAESDGGLRALLQGRRFIGGKWMYKHWDTSLRVIETVRDMRPDTAPAHSGCGTSLRAASAEALLRSQNAIWWIGDMLRAIGGLLCKASFTWIEVTAGLWEECMQLP